MILFQNKNNLKMKSVFIIESLSKPLKKIQLWKTKLSHLKTTIPW